MSLKFHAVVDIRFTEKANEKRLVSVSEKNIDMILNKVKGDDALKNETFEAVTNVEWVTAIANIPLI